MKAGGKLDCRSIFSGNFNSLIFELTGLILAHFVRRGTAYVPRLAQASHRHCIHTDHLHSPEW